VNPSLSRPLGKPKNPERKTSAFNASCSARGYPNRSSCPPERLRSVDSGLSQLEAVATTKFRRRTDCDVHASPVARKNCWLKQDRARRFGSNNCCPNEDPMHSIPQNSMDKNAEKSRRISQSQNPARQNPKGSISQLQRSATPKVASTSKSQDAFQIPN
jgi:hypothetical protein